MTADLETVFDRLKSAFSQGKIRLNEPMAPHTTFGVGGCADIFVEPYSESELADIVRLCAQNGVRYFIVGRGSNLLVKDGGIRGVVIHPAGEWFERIIVEGCEIECGSGARLKTVAGEALKNSLSGFEFLEGIPGTIGGALRMNAGAMGGEIFDIVKTIRIMNNQGEIREIKPEEAAVEYRDCKILRDNIALSAVLTGKPGNREEIAKKMDEFSKKRRLSQPQWRSAGCVFKNPPGLSAGKLIDELGLKGTKIGGAMVSNEHGNFIVNTGSATARDILNLIQFLKNEVKKQRGIELQTEIEIIGEDF